MSTSARRKIKVTSLWADSIETKPTAAIECLANNITRPLIVQATLMEWMSINLNIAASLIAEAADVGRRNLKHLISFRSIAKVRWIVLVQEISDNLINLWEPQC